MALAVTRPPRWRFVLDAVFLALALLFAWLIASGVRDTPFGGMRGPMYFFLAPMLIVAGNRALALVVKALPGGMLRNVLRVAKWTLPFALPYLAIPALEADVQARQLALAQRELAPLVRHAERHAKDLSAPRSVELPRLSFPRPVHYRRDLEADLVWLEVPTIDVDGALLVYDARARTWTRTHNDAEGARRPEADGTCELREGVWKCRDDDRLD